MINLGAVTLAIRLLQKPAVLNTPAGAFVDGVWAQQNVLTTIKAAVQAATQQDLIQYADHEKIDGFVRIWTQANLRTVDEDLEAEAQSIVSGGKTYRIIKAGYRDEAGFTRAIGRLQRDTGRSV